jgi:ribonuclease P protein component
MAAVPTNLFALPASRRIKQGRDFGRARVEGRRLTQGCLIMNWMPLPAGSCSRVGVITARRLGNAPARSRARRLLREAFRLRQHDLARPADIILVARPSIVDRAFGHVERDFVLALKKAGMLRAGST